MKKNKDILDINANIAIAFALAIIAFVLVYTLL
jgi:hypothetical protein